MNHSRTRPPVPLAGIHQGAYSNNGDEIKFTLEAQDGRLFTYSVPHEAVGEIVQALLALADGAAERRLGPPPRPGELVPVARAFPLQRFELLYSPQEGLVLLQLTTRNSLVQTLGIERQEAQALGASLLEVVKRTSN